MECSTNSRCETAGSTSAWSESQNMRHMLPNRRQHPLGLNNWESVCRRPAEHHLLMLCCCCGDVLAGLHPRPLPHRHTGPLPLLRYWLQSVAESTCPRVLDCKHWSHNRLWFMCFSFIWHTLHHDAHDASATALRSYLRSYALLGS
jgi:hypothetical protein